MCEQNQALDTSLAVIWTNSDKGYYVYSPEHGLTAAVECSLELSSWRLSEYSTPEEIDLPDGSYFEVVEDEAVRQAVLRAALKQNNL